MAFADAHAWYQWLPMWNTIILLTSSFTCHIAHMGILDGNKKKFNLWLGITVALGMIFLCCSCRILRGLCALWPDPELRDLRLNLLYADGLPRLSRVHGYDHAADPAAALRVGGQFTADDHFGFEASSWYWHFVDVVWVFLFLFVYISVAQLL